MKNVILCFTILLVSVSSPTISLPLHHPLAASTAVPAVMADVTEMAIPDTYVPEEDTPIGISCNYLSTICEANNDLNNKAACCYSPTFEQYTSFNNACALLPYCINAQNGLVLVQDCKLGVDSSLCNADSFYPD